MRRSANSCRIASCASTTSSPTSTSRMRHSMLPDSILARSSTSLMSRVNLSASRTMMARNSSRLAGSTSGLSRRISENARMVLLNLLSNAGRFCDPDSGRVEVRVTREDGRVRVDVADNGRGVPAEHLSRIFDKFHQVTDEQLGKPEGSGLGLAISHRIVDHHGGRIWAASEPGAGTTMSFELPAAADAPAADTPDGQHTGGAA